MELHAGKLRHRIDIDDCVRVQDDNGDPVVTWVPWATSVPAQVEFPSGKEYFTANQIQGQTQVRFAIRFREGVLQTMRVRYKGIAYNISSVLPDKDSGLAFLTIIGTAGVNDG